MGFHRTVYDLSGLLVSFLWLLSHISFYFHQQHILLAFKEGKLYVPKDAADGEFLTLLYVWEE